MSQTCGIADDLDPPKANAADAVHTAVAAAISAAPIVGGPAAELFDALVPASLERRRNTWRQRVADKLRELDDRGVDLGHLADDEAFYTFVIEATKAALGTHIEEKIELLARCVQTAALPDDRDDFVAMRLLLLVEALAPEHLLVLKYLSDPAGWYDEKGLEKPNIMGSANYLLDRAGLDVEEPIRSLVLRDLNDRGLADTAVLGAMMTNDGAWAPRAAPLGVMLLRFVQLI